MQPSRKRTRLKTQITIRCDLHNIDTVREQRLCRESLAGQAVELGLATPVKINNEGYTYVYSSQCSTLYSTTV